MTAPCLTCRGAGGWTDLMRWEPAAVVPPVIRCEACEGTGAVEIEEPKILATVTVEPAPMAGIRVTPVAYWRGA